jgi:hypothetical protein
MVAKLPMESYRRRRRHGILFTGIRVASESRPTMTKRQLIDDIRRYNTTATPEFLAQFDEVALRQYLDHLEGAFRKRLQISAWVRRKPKLKMVG